jgi:anti-anti-sigma factor
MYPLAASVKHANLQTGQAAKPLRIGVWRMVDSDAFEYRAGRYSGFMGPGEIAIDHADGGVAVITFSGEHDLNTAPELRDRLAEAIDAGRSIVVDLSGAAFIDSSIIGSVLDARRQAQEKELGFAVALTQGAQPVQRVLEVTGLTATLPVHETQEAALEEARSSGQG